MASRLSICLVVKNGKGSILRCLDALLPMANEYVVIDTGSTDGTLELLDDWEKRHPRQRVVLDKVGSKFHDEQGRFDFGAAKQYAIDKATCEYVMWVDVNDILQDGKHARTLFENIVAKYPNAGITMLTKVTDTYQFPRMRILPKANAKFVGNIHERVVNTDESAPTIHTKLVFENYKSTRDIHRNIAGLQKAWEDERTQRTAFYFGNSYLDLNDLGHAYEWYTVTVDQFPNQYTEDRFKALEEICALIVATKTDIDDLGMRSLQMIEEQPNRAEGYYYRARYNYEIGDFEFALKCLDKLITLRPPKEHSLWIDPKVYNKDDIKSMMFTVKEELNRSAANQLLYSDPMQPDSIEWGAGSGTWNGYGYGDEMNFGTTSPGFNTII